MAAVRISGLHGTSSDIVKYLHLHFKNSRIGGGCISNIYFPLLNNDAVIEFDERDNSVNTTRLASIESHVIADKQIQVLALPQQVFSQIVAIVSDHRFCQYLYECEETLGDIYQKIGVSVMNNNGCWYVTGNIFQVEWVWKYLAERIQKTTRTSKTDEHSDVESSYEETTVSEKINESLNEEGTCTGPHDEISQNGKLSSDSRSSCEINGENVEKRSEKGKSSGYFSEDESGVFDIQPSNLETQNVRANVDSCKDDDTAVESECETVLYTTISSEDDHPTEAPQTSSHGEMLHLYVETPLFSVNHDDNSTVDFETYGGLSPTEARQSHLHDVLQDLDSVHFSSGALSFDTDPQSKVSDQMDTEELDSSIELAMENMNVMERDELQYGATCSESQSYETEFDFFEITSACKRFDSLDSTEEQSSRKISLFVDVLDISKAETDVIGIVSDPKLNMSTTVVGRIIAKKAGSQFEKDCKHLMKQRKKEQFPCYDVVHTSAGGKLSERVNFIIHTFLPVWNSKMADKYAQELASVYFKTFSKADQLKARSITLPLMGTGNLCVPMEVSVAALKEGIGRFQNSQHSTCLSDIHVVNIHKKVVDSIRNTFLRDCKQTEDHAGSESYQPMTFSMKPMKRVSEDSRGLAKAECIIISDTLTIKIYTADITDANVDGIAMLTDKDLRHIGKISRIVSAKCGEKFKKDCKKYSTKNGELNYGDVMHVPTGNPSLNVKNVVMTCLEKWNKKDDDKHKRALLFAYGNLLQYANSKLGIESIAVYLLGTGEIGVEQTTSVAALFKALNMFSKYRRGTHTLKEIHVVNTDNEKTKAAYSLLKDLAVTGDEDLLRLGLDKFDLELMHLFLFEKD